MIEPSETQDDSVHTEAFSRLYDFFKHLTGVSLISIGGVLGLLQGEGPAIDPSAVVGIVACLGLAGLVSLMMLATIVSTGFKGAQAMAKLRKGALFVQTLAVGTLVFGLGLFTSVFVEGMKP